MFQGGHSLQRELGTCVLTLTTASGSNDCSQFQPEVERKGKEQRPGMKDRERRPVEEGSLWPPQALKMCQAPWVVWAEVIRGVCWVHMPPSVLVHIVPPVGGDSPLFLHLYSHSPSDLLEPAQEMRNSCPLAPNDLALFLSFSQRLT